MYEEDPKEESSFSQDLSVSNVPHMIISGNLKDGSKEGNHACVTRFCTIKITRLEIDDKSALPSTFVISVQLDRSRKTLSSIPLDLKQFEDNTLNLDFSFAFLYTHNLKPPSDYLKIYIQEKKKKRSASSERVYASTQVNLHRVLQCTLEDELVLTAPKGKKKKEEGRARRDTEPGKREDVKNEPKKEEKKKEGEVKKSETKDNLKEDFGELPVLHMNVTVTVYPDDVDSYQDAQEWDEEFLDTLMMETKNDYSTDEEELYESDEFTDEEDVTLTASPQTKTVENYTSALPLSEVMKSRYQMNTQKKEKRSKLNFKRVLKQIKREKGNKVAEEEEEDDEMFQGEEISLGSSSASDEEYEHQPYESPPPSNTRTKPVSIRPTASLSYDPTPPQSPLPNLNFTSPAADDSSIIILVDTQKRRGRKLEECLKEIRSLSSKVVGTKNGNDISSVLSSVISKQSRASTDLSELSLENSSSPIRVVIAGGDTYVNYVLRPFVEILSKKPRGYQAFSFYIIPVGKKNDIAMHIASLDPSYRSLFFSGDWRDDLLGKHVDEEVSEEQLKEIEKRVLKYLDEATSVYPFQIAEAMLSFSHGSQASNAPAVTKNVPFVKGLQIGSRDIEEKETDTADLQLDYWYSKKKGEGHKDVKTFQFTAITRLPAVANALHIENEYKPTPTTFSLITQFKDKSKMEKMKEALQHFGSKNKKKEDDIQIVTAKINRMTCSSATDTAMFRVLIDGVEWTGVTFVSVSPQWHSHIKAFPVQIFNNKSLSKNTI